MRILLTFDTGYAPHAATVMESIIQNCPEKLDFVVIYYDLTQEIQDILSKHFMTKVKSLEFVQVSEMSLRDAVKGIKIARDSWNLNIYLRLFAQVLLSDEGIIYLDCDTIVRDNILKIMEEVDLSKPICAVTEYNPAYKLRDLSKLKPVERPTYNPLIYEAYWYRTYIDLQMQPDCKYLCSGVMIINLEYWRKNKIMEQVMDFFVKYPEHIYAPDQDALNYVIQGNYSELHPRWNVMRQEIFSNYNAEMLEEAYRNPAIIHMKTWLYGTNKKYRHMYVHYRKFTPFRFIYKDKTVANIIRDYMKMILLFLIGEGNYRKIKSFIRRNSVNGGATVRITNAQ
jgi:lipopolysaccharide biosynthesis glycosyltransferase